MSQKLLQVYNVLSSYDEDHKIRFYTFGTLVHESQVNQFTMIAIEISLFLRIDQSSGVKLGVKNRLCGVETSVEAVVLPQY